MKRISATSQKKRFGTAGKLFFLFVLLLIVWWATVFKRDKLQKMGIKDKTINVIQWVSFISMLVLISVICFLIAPIIGGIVGTLLLVGGAASLLIGAVSIYSETKKPKVNQGGNNSTSAINSTFGEYATT